MSGSGAGNTMRERVGNWRGRFLLWFLLNLSRWRLTAALSTGLFIGLVVVGAVDDSVLRSTIRQGGPAKTIFRTYVGSLITGVTLVVTIS